MSRQLLSSVAALALVGCSTASLQEDRHATGSSSIAASSDYARVYVANTDSGELAIVSADGSLVERIDVGAHPHRIARAADRVFVSLRDEATLLVLREEGGSLSIEDRLDVGPEPNGLVADEHGTVLYAAVAMMDQVVQIDPVTLEITRRFSVGGQPRWLALHPSGRALYVGSAFGGSWSHIDLTTGEVHEIPLPDRVRDRFDGTPPVVLTPRVTGDPSVSPYGDFVVLPGLYVDNTTPVGDPGGDTVDSGGGYAAIPGGGVGRLNPVLTLVETDRDGNPELSRTRTLLVSGTVFEDGADFGETVRSYINSTTVSPDGMVVLAAMEASEAVIAVPMGTDTSGGRVREFDSGLGGFEVVPSTVIRTAAGPKGLVFVERDRPMLDAWLDRTVQNVPFVAARDALQSQIIGRGTMDFSVLGAEPGLQVFAPVLTPELEEGRRMFFRATDQRMAAHSGGISCATCHYEGRNDGVTWTFTQGLRQTPSLVGPVTQTEPVTWTDQVASVAMEVRITSEGRMGGSGVTVAESLDVASFLDITPYPDTLRPDADLAAIQRGGEIFFGSAGCAECHGGLLYTDTKSYPMFELPSVRTPTLRGVAATAPYLHDGRAADLAGLVEIAEDGGMGRTNHLTAAQKADLVAFLASL
jgi:DNA-binding beta-propeller fold protein YncE